MEWRVGTELVALVRTLIERINRLADRYTETVKDLDNEVAALGAKVAAHLAAMGVSNAR